MTAHVTHRTRGREGGGTGTACSREFSKKVNDFYQRKVATFSHLHVDEYLQGHSRK